jgi:hypothetical protein
MLVGRVVHDQLDQNLDAPLVGGNDQRLEVVEHAVTWMHVLVVGDVVPVVLERRGKERQQPQARDAEAVQVIELLREALKIAYAVVVAVEEGLDVRLIDDGVLVPERIVFGSRGRRVHRVGRNGDRQGDVHRGGRHRG